MAETPDSNCRLKDGNAVITMSTADARDSNEPARATSPGIEEPSRHSVVTRTLGPLTVNGIRHSMLTLTSTALGGGVLSVSYVMVTVGLALGTALLVLGALLAFLSTTALMRMSGQTGHSTYAGLFSHCAGRLAGPILDLMLFIYGNGACVGYMVFLGDFVPPLISLGGDAVPQWLAGRELAIIAAAGLTMPMALQRDIAVLRYVAPVSILALVYMAVTVAVKSPHQYQQHVGDPAYGSIRWAIPGVHITDAFALCVFAFNCHLNVLPVAGSMVRPTRARIVKVSARVNLVQLSFYMLIGITGYISFLAKTPGDIIKAYSADDVSVIIGRVMLSCTMIVAIPINLNPTVRSGMQIRDYFRLQDEPFLASPGAITPPDSPVLSTAETSCGCRSCVTIVCLVVQAILAILVPGVADILGLLGATVATAMIMTIPAYCMGVVMPMTTTNLLQQVLLYMFSLVSLASVPIKILTWAKVIQ